MESNFRNTIREINALTYRELKKWINKPHVVIMMLIQPVLWMGLFGKAFNLTGIFKIPENILNSLPPYATQAVQQIFNSILTNLFGQANIDYFSYMAIGMTAVVALFAGLQTGMSLSWDRRLGYLNKLLASPISRGSIIVGKVLGGTVKALVQVLVIILIAIPLGLKLQIASASAVVAAALGITLFAMGIGMLMISITLRVKSWETQMTVMNLLNLPLMFTSNVLTPLAMMPSWLQTFAKFNPLTYAADIMRQALIMGSYASYAEIMRDLVILAGVAIALITIGVVAANRALRKE
ncbi:ABC transporter permease [Fervidicoccus sp.]|uniref:ABC transporter permease n=1 Tax=Fervidicoccus sp. TaxID=2060324 RepID=UPI003D118BD6